MDLEAGRPRVRYSLASVPAPRAGLGWPMPDDLDDAQLEARLFAKPEPPPSAGRPLPDWPAVHRELRRTLPQKADGLDRCARGPWRVRRDGEVDK